MTIQKMIIDTHAHIGHILDFNMTTEQLLYSMERYGVDFTLFSHIEAVEFDHMGNAVPPEFQRSQNELFREAVAEARKAPGKLGVLPWLKIHGEQPDREFEAILKENRGIVYGLKLHPFHSRTAPDDPRLEPVYELAMKYNLPVVSHTGGCEEAMSVHLYNAAKTHPQLDFVMVHMDLGTDNKTALDLLGRLPNLYGDTTWVPVETTVEAIRRYGSQKMLFGTDNPIDGADTLLHNKAGDRSLYQEYFHELKERLGAEEYADLMFRNAQRVFHIS